MAEIIESWPLIVGRNFVFGAPGDGGYSRWSAAKKALDERCGVTGFTLHDVRRTVATRMSDLGVAPHVVEQILNHQSGHKRGPAGIYNKSRYEREVRAALALWHDHLGRLAQDGERKVVPITSGRAS